MKIKYMWLNQNGTQSARHIYNSNKVSLGNANKKNLRESNQNNKTKEKIKRFRSAFTTYQINYLEAEFKKFPYIDTTQRKEVAAALNISERAVKIWFQNRRMKEKKEINLRDPDDEKSDRIIADSAEEQSNVVNTVQSTTGTQLDSLPLIINSVVCSNIRKLKQDENRKINNIIRSIPCNNHVNMSKETSVPKFTLYKNNKSNTISSGKHLPDFVKLNNKNANEHITEQSPAQLKKYKLTSFNKSNVISKYFIPEELSGNRQKASPQKHRMFSNGEDSNLSKMIKRFRSAFTTEQTNCLERVFKNVQYIGNTQRKELADALNISESAVKIWFQNRRMKEKKEPSIKEYKEHINRKILEFPNEQLTVLNNVQSTNEQASWSMPLLETCIDNVINSNKESNLINQINTTDVKNSVKGNSENNNSLHEKDNKLSNNIYKHVGKTDIKQQEPSLMKDIHPKCYQEMPQDLSLKKQKSSETQKAEIKLTNICPNTAYIPQRGILWKPINIVPVVSADSHISLPFNNSSNLPLTQEQHLQKIKCNCDCHVKVVSNPTVLQNSTNPHIIFTTLPISSYIQNPSFNVNI